MVSAGLVKTGTPLVFENLASAVVDPKLLWEPLCEGIEAAWLYYTPNGPRSAFLRYAVGARLPAHAHVGYEHIIVLSGSQSDHSGLHGPGAMIINPPGTSHAVYSAIGCLVLAIWEKPVVFGAKETAEE